MTKSDTSVSGSGDDFSQPWQSYHTVYTNAKAGMDGVDKERVQRIVYDMSKGSKYFENEERKEAYMRQKIESMRGHCAKLTAEDTSNYEKVADKRILELEATRDLSRIWLHVDMDAFYAAVETLSDPSLKGKPMAVGSMSMISTANYEARRFGVRAAMPGFIARKLCPELIFVPTDFKKYIYYSDLTRKVFQKFDPNFMAASLDEAYLDITNVCKDRAIESGEVAEELRTDVHRQTGLTCSAGVAPNRLLAKVCSDINKPNGQFVLPNDRMAVMAFISSVPIRKVGGIGKVTEHVLRDVLGIKTCEEMLQKSSFLCALFSRSSADFFLSVGLGLGRTETPPVKLRKSMSSERTFVATEDEGLFCQKLGDLAEMLSEDLRKEGLSGRTLTLKLKTASFEVRTRAVTLQKYICSSGDILKHALKLLTAELPVSLRLIGLRISQFSECGGGIPSDPTQKTLSNFIISGDASRNNTSPDGPLATYVSDGIFHDNSENSISTDGQEMSYDCRHDSNHIADSMDNDCMLSHATEEAVISPGPLTNLSKDEVHDSSIVGPEVKSCEPGALQSIGTDLSSLQGPVEGSSLNEPKKRPSVSDDEGSSSNQKEPLFWVDGYMCSLCGVELPPSFVDERQEHSDYHLAEMLQEEEEESRNRNREITPKRRFIQKEHISSQSRSSKKKHKASPTFGKHLPIDVFFVKKNQNP